MSTRRKAYCAGLEIITQGVAQSLLRDLRIQKLGVKPANKGFFIQTQGTAKTSQKQMGGGGGIRPAVCVRCRSANLRVGVRKNVNQHRVFQWCTPKQT